MAGKRASLFCLKIFVLQSVKPENIIKHYLNHSDCVMVSVLDSRAIDRGVETTRER